MSGYTNPSLSEVTEDISGLGETYIFEYDNRDLLSTNIFVLDSIIAFSEDCSWKSDQLPLLFLFIINYS